MCVGVRSVGKRKVEKNPRGRRGFQVECEMDLNVGFRVGKTGFQIWVKRKGRDIWGPGFALGWNWKWGWRWPHLWVVNRKGLMKNWFSMRKVTEGVS
ncbi:hypothetical protein LCGC14_0450970 [marine sediment metagenome]|uniref:Uncharacterized protein n=1 Tax=marine sediment metagenome TaxID=412755 RepID=A0A0F9V4L0_9ZZZZ